MVNQFVAVTRDRIGCASLASSTPARTREEVEILPFAAEGEVEIVRLLSVASDGWAVIETADYGTESADGYFLCQKQLADEADGAAAEAARYACCIG